MSAKKTVKAKSRASDVGPLLMSGSSGFAVRKKTGVGMFVHFFLLACMIILGASLLVHFRSLEGCMLAMAIGVCFAIIAHNLERTKKIKQYLEFMNALFSSALGKGYQFCCVVKSTGEVVFYNRPFQTIFPKFLDQSDRSIGALMSLYQVPAADQDKLKGFMSATSDGSVTTTLRDEAASTSLSLTLHVEAIDRPTGFFLVRGK